MTQHPIVHIEFASSDPTQASQFYQQLFGWEVEPVPGLDYVMYTVQENLGGGFPRIDGEMYKKGDVLVYIATNNIEASLDRVESLGGKTLLGRSEIPGMGWFALFADPSGTRVGIFEALKGQEG